MNTDEGRRNVQSQREAVRKQLDTFEFEKARRLVRTLRNPPLDQLKAKKQEEEEAARKESENKTRTLEERKREEREKNLRELQEKFAGRGGSSTAEIQLVAGRTYMTFPKPLDIGASRVMTFLLCLGEISNNDIIFFLRQKYHHEFSAGFPTVKKVWKGITDKSTTLSMPNATAAFPKFLDQLVHYDEKAADVETSSAAAGAGGAAPQEGGGAATTATKEHFYIDKREAEKLYRLLNERSTTPLDYVTAFTKLYLALCRVDDASYDRVMELFFGSCFSNLRDNDFLNVLDLQTIVSSFQSTVESLVEEEAQEEVLVVGGGGAKAGGDSSIVVGTPLTAERMRILNTFKSDILQYSASQPLKNYVTAKQALANPILMQSSFAHYLKHPTYFAFVDQLREEVAEAARERKQKVISYSDYF